MDAMALHLRTGSPPLERAHISRRLPEVYLWWCKRRECCYSLKRPQERPWRPFVACAALAERREMWVPALSPPTVLTARDSMGPVTWTATLTVIRKVWQNPLHPLLDALEDSLLHKRVVLELISEDLDPVTGRGKTSQPSYLTNFEQNIFRGRTVQYSAELTVDHQFGSPAAITILNNHSTELYVETICLESPLVSEPIFFKAESHVHTTINSPEKRVFFKNQSYLPADTPAGIRDWRERDLESLRGDGTGERQYWERVYDYDVYNDVGHNDLLHSLRRPVLGGCPERPYPRRLRTGRRKSKGDPSQESQAFAMMKNYVPRDEAFSPGKTWDFFTAMKGAFTIVMPFLETSLTDAPREFDSLGDIVTLYAKQQVGPQRLLHKLGKKISAQLRHPVPRLIEGDTMRWNTDEEFGRQILAGMNPTVVERLKVFPPESALDEATYGPKTSAITAQHLEKNLGGLTVEEALEQKRLYIVDYHDAILPLVSTFAAQGDKSKVYAPRVILFYTLERVFKPVAIELSRPSSETQTKTTTRVFTPGTDVTTSWLWLFAKIHFSLVDLGVHELYTHWLRAHVASEPYIIATHRHLSSLHPVLKLLHPHFRYTLEINAVGRKTLVAPAGIIELCQFPGKHALFTSSRFYSLLWRFDRQSLPGDLIGRGMAEKDPTAPHGLKLALEDYPHAADGLLLWNAIETFVAEYLSIYYTDSRQVQDDTELQAWWHEIRTVGHEDKKDEPWWPVLKTKDDLVQVVSTMIWTCSCHHAAANFGQYAYAGYMPNRPVHARRFIPEEGDAEWEEFLTHPDRFLLSMLPDRPNSTVQMLVTACLATHSRDEEYLGERKPHWTGDDAALTAFDKFSKAIDAVQEEMEMRNRNPMLKLRHGAGVIPYHLLYPKSGPGITGRGVPNSITI